MKAAPKAKRRSKEPEDRSWPAFLLEFSIVPGRHWIIAPNEDMARRILQQVLAGSVSVSLIDVKPQSELGGTIRGA